MSHEIRRSALCPWKVRKSLAALASHPIISPPNSSLPDAAIAGVGHGGNLGRTLRSMQEPTRTTCKSHRSPAKQSTESSGPGVCKTVVRRQLFGESGNGVHASESSPREVSSKGNAPQASKTPPSLVDRGMPSTKMGGLSSLSRISARTF